MKSELLLYPRPVVLDCRRQHDLTRSMSHINSCKVDVPCKGTQVVDEKLTVRTPSKAPDLYVGHFFLSIFPF
jgi:hypothetical protein